MDNEKSNENNITINIPPLELVNIDKINHNEPNSMECPICFDNINLGDALLILDCCGKKVHIKCIVDWYTKYPNNRTCFICNQTNNFCKDLVYDSRSSEINNENSSVNNSVDNSSVIQIDNNNSEQEKTRCTSLLAAILCPCALIVFFTCSSIIVIIDHLMG